MRSIQQIPYSNRSSMFYASSNPASRSVHAMRLLSSSLLMPQAIAVTSLPKNTNDDIQTPLCFSLRHQRVFSDPSPHINYLLDDLALRCTVGANRRARARLIVRCTRTLHSAACGVWQVRVAKCRALHTWNILYMCIRASKRSHTYIVRSHRGESSTGHELSFFVRHHRLLFSSSPSFESQVSYSGMYVCPRLDLQ